MLKPKSVVTTNIGQPNAQLFFHPLNYFSKERIYFSQDSNIFGPEHGQKLFSKLGGGPISPILMKNLSNESHFYKNSWRATAAGGDCPHSRLFFHRNGFAPSNTRARARSVSETGAPKWASLRLPHLGAPFFTHDRARAPVCARTHVRGCKPRTCCRPKDVASGHIRADTASRRPHAHSCACGLTSTRTLACRHKS